MTTEFDPPRQSFNLQLRQHLAWCFAMSTSERLQEDKSSAQNSQCPPPSTVNTRLAADFKDGHCTRLPHGNKMAPTRQPAGQQNGPHKTISWETRWLLCLHKTSQNIGVHIVHKFSQLGLELHKNVCLLSEAHCVQNLSGNTLSLIHI